MKFFEGANAAWSEDIELEDLLAEEIEADEA